MAWSKTPTTTVVQSSGHAGAHALVTPIVVASNISFHPANEASGSNVIGTPPSIPMIGEGTGPGVPFVTPSENASPVLAHPAVHSPVIRTSSVMQGMLVRRVEPRYPPVAIAARIEGPVKIKAIISREGRIEQAEVLNGSPLLSGAALEAIRQWRYRPYILNGEPVEVETQITVNFVLGR
jgi:protein TonB